jgi:hypothetical protein
VSNASKLGVSSLGDDYESFRQADELVEVAHIGYPGLESVKGTEVPYQEVVKFTMHSLAQTSEETVDMTVDLVDGDVGVAVLC